VLSNYRTRCDVCHNAKTAREDGGFGRAARGLHASVRREGGPQAPTTGGGAGQIPGVGCP
jgi:hypothetical protein